MNARLPKKVATLPLRVRLEASLEALAETDRRVLTLRLLEGLSALEVAGAQPASCRRRASHHARARASRLGAGCGDVAAEGRMNPFIPVTALSDPRRTMPTDPALRLRAADAAVESLTTEQRRREPHGSRVAARSHAAAAALLAIRACAVRRRRGGRVTKSKKSVPAMRVVEGARPAAAFGAEHAADLSRPKVHTIVVASGKTGVGKSSIAANLAVALGQRRARVVLVDADLAQSHLDLLLGVHPRFDLGQVINREKSVDEILVPGPTGVMLVPGPSALRPIGALDDIRRETLLRSLSVVDPAADLMIIDAPWGAGRETLELCRIAHEVIVVASTEVMSLPDAYALLEVAAEGGCAHARPASAPQHGDDRRRGRRDRRAHVGVRPPLHEARGRIARQHPL
jgi:Mrp family chromosome partitioning ATPase